MDADELHHRWDHMLAQAQRFADMGTTIEAVFRGEIIVAEAAEHLEGLPEGGTKVKLATLAKRIEGLLDVWRAELAEDQAAAAARGAKERERELELPDYEALLGEGYRGPGRAA